MAAHSPATAASRLPRSTLRHSISRASAARTSAGRSGASNSVRSSDAVDDRSHQRPARHRGQPQRDGPLGLLPRPDSRRARSGRGRHHLVRGELLLRLAPDRRLLVEGRGDARVGHAAPPEIERDGRRRRPPARAVRLLSGCHCTSAGRATRSTDDPGPSAATPPRRRSRCGPGCRESSPRRARPGRTGAGRAGSAGCRSPPPTRAPPGAGPGSARRRAAAGPRRAPRPAPSTGGRRSCCPRARRRWCAVPVVPVVEDRHLVLRRYGRPTCRGRSTTGNSSPLLRWMVITCTASASDSRRRARSSFSVSVRLVDPPPEPGGHGVGPRPSETPASWSSCATWRRSVMKRSPDGPASTRAGTPCELLTVSYNEATPSSRSRAAHRCRDQWRSSHRSSSAVATCLGRPTDETSQRRRARPGHVPSAARAPRAAGATPAPDSVANTEPAAADHGGHAGPVQCVTHRHRVAVDAHEHGDVAGVQRDAPLSRSRRAGV